jgi:hypothetical protein
VKRVRNPDRDFEGERTRPLSLVGALIKLYLENVPVEHFQRKKISKRNRKRSRKRLCITNLNMFQEISTE